MPAGSSSGGPGDETRAKLGEEPPEPPRRAHRHNAAGQALRGEIRGHLTGHRGAGSRSAARSIFAPGRRRPSVATSPQRGSAVVSM
jgi:hypothetical protein